MSDDLSVTGVGKGKELVQTSVGTQKKDKKHAKGKAHEVRSSTVHRDESLKKRSRH